MKTSHKCGNLFSPCFFFGGSGKTISDSLEISAFVFGFLRKHNYIKAKQN